MIDFQPSAVLKIAKDKVLPTMIIRWNKCVRKQSVAQPKLIRVKEWIENYAEA